ncbi:MAG: DNA alkylation repair protein [Pseudomonadota bacterium]
MAIPDKLVALLEPLADPARAAPMRAYMKNRFEFLGIGTPARRAAITPLLRSLKGIASAQLLDAAGQLWRMPRREYQYCALDLLARHWKQLSLADLDALLGLVREQSWWDSVDGLASVIGDIVRRERTEGQARMDAALLSSDLWTRRVAMLHQNGWRGDTDQARLFAYARQLAPEPDFFIRKAIGWALRDYARHDPEGVRHFLAAETGRFSGLTVREAAKHL